jgi:hypothetical protein
MTYIQVHQSLLTHRKTYRMAKLLERDPFYVVGLLIAFWAWAVDNAPNGQIFEEDHDVLADVLHISEHNGYVTGSVTKIIEVMLQTRFLDVHENGDIFIHDWDDYVGRLIDGRAKNAAKQRAWRARQKAEKAPEPSPQKPKEKRNWLRNRDATSYVTDKNRIENSSSNSGNNSSVGTNTTVTTITTLANAPDKPVRARNEIYDALVEIIGPEPTTPTAQRFYGKCSAELRKAGATPDEMRLRAPRYALMFPNTRLTPSALAKWWDSLADEPKVTSVPHNSNRNGYGNHNNGGNANNDTRTSAQVTADKIAAIKARDAAAKEHQRIWRELDAQDAAAKMAGQSNGKAVTG